MNESFGVEVANRAMPFDEHLITIKQNDEYLQMTSSKKDDEDVYDIAIPEKAIDPWIPPGVGYVLPMLLIFYIVCFRRLKFREHLNCAVLFLLCAITSLFVTTNEFFPWKFMYKLIGALQFPWRIFVFATMFTAFAVGAMYLFNKSNIRRKGFSIAFVAICVVAIAVTYTTTMNLNTPNQETSTFFNAEQNYWPDYLPNEVVEGALAGLSITGEPAELITFSNYNNSGINWNVHFDKKAQEVICEFPVIWYKGFTAKLDNEQRLATSYGNNDVVRVVIPADITSGTLTLSYSGTVIQKISFVLSILGFVSLVGILAIRRIYSQSRIRAI
jgi:hypothetical protein